MACNPSANAILIASLRVQSHRQGVGAGLQIVRQPDLHDAHA